MHLYQFSFHPGTPDAKRIVWQRYGTGTEAAHALAVAAALKDYPSAHSFSTVWMDQ